MHTPAVTWEEEEEEAAEEAGEAEGGLIQDRRTVGKT